MRLRSQSIAIFFLALPIFLVTAHAQDSAVEQVRQAYYKQDGAPQLAAKLAAEHPDDAALQHWYFALEDLETIDTKFSKVRYTTANDPWTLLVRARYASDWEKGILLDAAIAAAPDDMDILVLSTQEMQQILFQSTDKEQNKAFRALLASFLNEHASGYEKSAHGLSAQAYAEEDLAKGKDDIATTSAPMAAKLVDRALAMDPNDVQALLVKSKILVAEGRKQANYELLRRPILAGADSPSLYEVYFSSVLNDPSLNTEDQKKVILATMKLALDSGSPNRRLVNVFISDTQAAGSDTTAAVENLILKRYPNSVASDTVLFMQAAMSDPAIASDPNSPEKMQALEEYLDLPNHPDPENIEQARSFLISIMSKQDKPDLDRLYKELTTQHSVPYADGPAVAKLAENKYRLPDLERIATKQFDEQTGLIAKRTLDQSDKQGFAYFALSYFLSPWQNALGLIYFEEGHLDEAQEKLLSAASMSPESLTIQLRLGKVYEAKHEYVEAQKIYTAALAMDSFGPEEHPAVGALRNNYLLQHPDKAGVDVYMKDILQKDVDRRRAAVLKDRNSAPKSVPTFALKTLDGKTLTSKDLIGKVVVINFWATWCGPCREELPDFEKLWEKYRDDPNVLIVSMATDSVDTPVATIANFIKAHKYSFPVLLGPKFATDNSITPIPMSWFIGPDGQEIFRKIGYTKELVQEFSWRVEFLRPSKDGTSASTPKPGN